MKFTELKIKWKRIAGFFMIAPLALLCSCTSTPSLSINANWYKNTNITTVDGTSEKLEYEVTFTPSSTTDGISVEYDTGAYTTELSNETLTLSDGTTKGGYVYTTSLEISGRYTVNGETGDTFNDYVRSTVKFLPVGDKLQPVESEKTVKSTSALTSSPSDSATISNVTSTYYYSYAVTYDAALENATATYTDLSSDSSEPVVKEYDITGDGTYLDNEEIIFALRGLDLSSSWTIRTINQMQSAVSEVSVSGSATEETVSFEMDGSATEATVTAYSTTIIYNTTVSGQAQSLVYAAKTDAENNTYRNVLLRMEVPVSYSLGTLQYSLTKAEFSTKS